MPGTALVVAGGARPDPAVVAALPSVDYCVAADGGADHALAMGLTVDAVVGDMDSISAGALAELTNRGAEVRDHPKAKDQTDLELALGCAAEQRPDRLVAIGIGGGRLDHALANIAVLAADYGSAAVEALVGTSRLTVIRDSRDLLGALGEIVSLLPLLGTVGGVTTAGLEFPLVDEPLIAGEARGVSNRFVAPVATVTVRDGVLIAVQPHALSERGRR